MPIPQIVRVDPLDLQKRRAIGISHKFNKETGVFNSTFSTKDQIKSNLINLLLTTKGERVNNLEFGTNFKRLLFEPLTDILTNSIKENILISINEYIPQITVTNMDITPNPEENSVTTMVSYILKLSGNADQIYIDFSTIT
jgi:phage baseplate assembly protein W